MEQRKLEEIQFHDNIRSLDIDDPHYERQHSNRKFYSIGRRTETFPKEWLLQRCANRRVLVFGCGSGAQSFYLAKANAQVAGIDISSVAIGLARKRAIQEGVEKNTSFYVMDCEAMAFPDNCFDIIIAAGVLHHLDLPRAYREMARTLKPDGQIICVEALGHNPVIQLYRKLTPHLRTAWEAEHILRMKDLKLARRFFAKVDARFYHLFTLAAVPFRRTRIFSSVLSAMEAIDKVVLRVPFIRTQAWQVIFILSQPNKELFKQDRHNPC